MILDYPPIYEGELLSSYIYRYHSYTGYSSFSDTALEIWGRRGKWISSILFPSNAYVIIRQLGIKEEQYIKNHTVLQFYKFFLQQEKCKGIEQEMLYSSTVHIETLQKNVLIDYDNLSFSYCPKCISDNNNLLIIKREHQITGVYVCALHGCFLEKYIIRNRRDRINFDEFDFKACVHYNDNKMLIDFSKSVLYIFNEIFNIGFPEIIYYLKTRLIQEGLLGKDGRVNTSKEILFKKSFHDAPEIYRNAIWSSSLGHIFDLNNYSLIKPLIFIIVITKLYESFENFYKEAISLIKKE